MSGNIETNTIRPRTITLALSDADCNRLMDRCGEYGITVSELFETFAGDLIDGTFSNGSDERMLANQWFDRCCFDFRSGNTLLKHLLYNWIDPEEFFDTVDTLNSAYEEKEFLLTNPNLCEPDNIPDVEDLISQCQSELRDCISGWIPDDDSTPINELQNIAKWIDSRNRLLLKTNLDTHSEAVQHFRPKVVEECFNRYENRRLENICL